jgi:hypothetical protein
MYVVKLWYLFTFFVFPFLKDVRVWVILQKVAIFIFQIQKNKTVIGTSLLNSKHSNNIKESEQNMYFNKFNQYMLTYVIIYDLVLLFVIPVTLLFFFVQKNPKR